MQTAFRQFKKSRRNPSPSRSPFVGKLFCGCCGRAMSQQSKQPYHLCRGSRLKTGQGCYDGKIFIDMLNEVVLSSVKAEVRKFLNFNQMRSLQKPGQPERDTLIYKIKKVKGHIALLENRNVSLYEDFADGGIDKDFYITAKAKNSAEVEKAQTCISELENEIRALDSRMSDAAVDEPLLLRIIKATKASDEILSLVERINVFDSQRVEIKFAFDDSKILEGSYIKNSG